MCPPERTLPGIELKVKNENQALKLWVCMNSWFLVSS